MQRFLASSTAWKIYAHRTTCHRASIACLREVASIQPRVLSPCWRLRLGMLPISKQAAALSEPLRLLNIVFETVLDHVIEGEGVCCMEDSLAHPEWALAHLPDNSPQNLCCVPGSSAHRRQIFQRAAVIFRMTCRGRSRCFCTVLLSSTHHKDSSVQTQRRSIVPQLRRRSSKATLCSWLFTTNLMCW